MRPVIDYGLTSIVGDRIDACIRQGEQISKDMIAVRISPDWRFPQVDGQLTFNTIMPGFQAALDGLCLAYVPDDLSRLHIERGELREVLAAWSLRCQGFHLYYPNRRQASPAFSVLVDALRYQAGSTQLT